MFNFVRKVSWKSHPLISYFLGDSKATAICLQLDLNLFDYIGPKNDIWSGVIFIHIPKAAGSSILNTGVKWTLGHKPISFYQRHLPKGTTMPPTFAVVRNPYDRYLSAFYFLKNGGITTLDKEWAKQNIPDDSDHNDFAINHLHKKNVIRWMHFIPQTAFICSEDNEILVDECIKLENINQDWQTISKKFNLCGTLPHYNSTQYKTSHKLSEAAKSKIKSLYSKDFLLLNYNI